MAAFSSTTFNAARYQASRPTTPPELLEVVYGYHSEGGGEWLRCLDLGCGTGQTSRLLSERFEEVNGVDASSTMINIAKQTSDGTDAGSKIKYTVTPAEDLAFLKDASVDMVAASQAAHWFNYEKLWPELARILKPNGTVAFWNYGHMRLPKHLPLAKVIIDFTDGPAPDGLQGCYEEPGFGVSESLLEAVPAPAPTLPFSKSSFRRLKFSAGYVPLKDIPDYLPEGQKPEIREVLLKRHWTWDQLSAHCRTWSGYHTYESKHPEDKEQEGGDIVARMIKKLKDAVIKDGGDEESFDVEWSIGLLLVKKSG